MLIKFEEKKWGEKMNYMYKLFVMFYGSYIKDLKCVGMWGVKFEFYENGSFIKSMF